MAEAAAGVVGTAAEVAARHAADSCSQNLVAKGGSNRVVGADATAFEEICVELLEQLGFDQVEWRGGPGDHNIDIVAFLPVVDPLGKKRTERWAVQCKHTPSRTTSWKELYAETAGAEEDGADVFCLITSGKLSSDAKRSVEKHNAKKPPRFRINFLEGRALALLLDEEANKRRAKPGAHALWEAGQMAAVQEAWVAELDPKEAAELVRAMVARPIDPRNGIAYLEQHHDVRYLASDMSRTELTLTLVNVGDDEMEEDLVTFQGDAPSSPSNLDLSTRDADGELAHDIHFDSGRNLVLAVKFRTPLVPLEVRTLQVGISWPFRPPLRSVRHYGMPTFRLTRRHSFSVMVPPGVVADRALLVNDRDGVMTTVAEPEFETGTEGARLSGIVESPAIGDHHKLIFTLR